MKKTSEPGEVTTAAPASKQPHHCAVDLANEIWGGAQPAIDAIQRAIDGEPIESKLGENQSAPIDAASELFWAAKLLSTVRHNPTRNGGSESILRKLRDQGNQAAGVLYNYLGANADLPLLGFEVIGDAAVWAVLYVDQRIEANEKAGGVDNCFKRAARKDLIVDLFLRCIGNRRGAYFNPWGAPQDQIEPALFFRKLYDLGGVENDH